MLTDYHRGNNNISSPLTREWTRMGDIATLVQCIDIVFPGFQLEPLLQGLSTFGLDPALKSGFARSTKQRKTKSPLRKHLAPVCQR